MNAITSAAVTLQMARVYRRGEVSICCSKFLLKRTLKRKEESTTVIKDEETDFGLWIAEYLTDIARHQKRRRDDRELAIRHNNKIGRNVSLKCRNIFGSFCKIRAAYSRFSQFGRYACLPILHDSFEKTLI